MLKYNITEGTGGRVVILQADDLMRYALHDSNDTPIKFIRKGSHAIAITTTPVTVYRKPTSLALHKEVMLHNARSLWLGFTPKFDRVARNLYEYTETI